MWTSAIIATAAVLAVTTAADAKARLPGRVVHLYADTIVIYPKRVVLPDERIVVHADRIIRMPPSMRPTRAALIACQMGPNFLGAAWGRRYRPYTRTGRPRICVNDTG